MKKNKVTLLNIITSIILQFVTIISGFIIPRIILSYFGSEVNGLVSSLNQLLSYISILEGGVTSVVLANLYKPLINGDYYNVSSVLKTANSFYKKIGFLFIIYSLLLATIYPLVFNTGFSYAYISSLTIILSMNLFVQYMFSLTMKSLLNADKKIYIISISQIIMIILNITLAIISVKIYPSIHLLKFFTGVLYFIQPIIYGLYISKHYNLDSNAVIDNNLLKNRWDGFAINVAAFIHYCTDATVLSLFTSFEVVSIYSVYCLITNGIRQFVNAFTNAMSPTIGQAYAKSNVKELKQKFESYEFILIFIVFFVFSVAIFLITPFVLIYSKGVSDTNYNQPVFGYLLLLSEALYLIKMPHLNLAYGANKFKEISRSCFIEALLNIIISIILVKRFGLIGITIGTCIAMLYRMIYQVDFSKELLNYDSNKSFYKKLFLFVIGLIVGITICNIEGFEKNITIYIWMKYAIKYSIIFGIIYCIIGYFFFKNEIKYIIKYFIKRKGVRK